MSGGTYSLGKIIRFVREADKRGLCFGGWPSDILGIYLSWHSSNGSLVIVEEEGNLVALAVGTQMHEGDLDKHWQAWNREGDSVLLTDIVATTKRGVAACVDELANRCPNWKELKLFAVRHGKRRRFNPEVLERAMVAWS